MRSDFDKYKVSSLEEVPEKIRFLEDFVSSQKGPGPDPVRFARFLFTEMLESEYETWSRHCHGLLGEILHNGSVTVADFFDESSLAWELIGDRNPDQKLMLLDLCLDWVLPEHSTIYEWLESQIDSRDSRIRSACRKRLDVLDQKRDMDGEASGLLGALEYSTFMEMSSKSKLRWLSGVESQKDRAESLVQWGLQALAVEQDRFVLSRLARLLPLVFHERLGESSRVPMLVHGLMEHEDARVRSNTLEGLWRWAASDGYRNMILGMAQAALRDRDPRVRTGAARLLYSQDDKRALNLIHQMVLQVANLEELNSIRWLLQSVRSEELYQADLEAAQIRLQAELAVS